MWKLLLLIFTFQLVSCVGTVEENKDLDTESDLATEQEIRFDGLVRAEGVAHDKVELSFAPSSISPENASYIIVINNSPSGLVVKGTSLTPNSAGLIIYTVKGLRVNSEYSFLVKVRDDTTGQESQRGTTLTTRTFSNLTADFSGISTLSLPAGEAGQTNIDVEWIPAVIRGSQFSPQGTDPVAYEVKVISQGGPENLNNDNYTAPDLQTFITPTDVNTSSPSLTDEREFRITNLNPSTTYHVQVRAIHKDYYANNSDPTYKREENSKFLTITTKASSNEFDFNSSGISLAHPSSNLGLTAIDVAWDGADGNFDHYRLYYYEVASDSESDQLTSADIDLVNADNHPNDIEMVNLSPSNNFYRIQGLNSHRWHQIKIVACGDISCDPLFRIESDLVQLRTDAILAPFGGILTIGDPRDETQLDRVFIQFDSPVTEAGFLNRLEVYCVDDENGSNPRELVFNQAIDAAGSPCNGLTLRDQNQLTLSSFSDLEELEISGVSTEGGQKYCFLAIPVIDDGVAPNNQVDRNINRGIVKCSIPEVQVPSLEEFPGKTQICQVVGGTNLRLRWNPPSGGIYSRYAVFWKEKDGRPFKFAEAIQALADNDTSTYGFADGISRGAVQYDIDTAPGGGELIPGKEYLSGVLTYTGTGQRYYSEPNVNTLGCQIPLPQMRFNEWTRIFAVGPKVNGMLPPEAPDDRKFIPESLHVFGGEGVPQEVVVDYDDDYNPTNSFSANRGVNFFDGVYGSIGASEANNLHIYSNSGIVQLMWKDVTTAVDSTVTLEDLRESFDPDNTADGNKELRQVGYKVFRSDDGKASWIDLTRAVANTTRGSAFQSDANEGLIISKPYSYRHRNNSDLITEDIATFTDYSVRFADANGDIDRARVYWYRIQPYFFGRELTYTSGTQHIVKVVLPPPNMSLVNRLSANRAMCLELEKIGNNADGVYIGINKSNGGHYECIYNGLGASPIEEPWAPSPIASTFDIGGDLLVDRFEMGCNFTRGAFQVDEDGVAPSPESVNTDLITEFDGTADSGQVYKGCRNDSPLSGYANDTGSEVTDWMQVTSGDCFGEDRISIPDLSETCTNPNRNGLRAFTFPGGDGRVVSDCQVESNLSEFFDFNSLLAQSEYGAVYYLRNTRRIGSYGAKVMNRYAGANGTDIVLRSYSNSQSSSHNTRGSCLINIPYGEVVGGDTFLRARWFSIRNLLEGLGYNGQTVDLTNLSLNDILDHSAFYDFTSVLKPNSAYLENARANKDIPVAKLLSSNNAKLPALTMLDHEQTNTLCSLYQVEVGVQNGDDFSVEQEAKSKRLMTKKEFNTVAAWPDNYDSGKVTTLERGERTQNIPNPTQDGVRTENVSCNASLKLVNSGQDSIGLGTVLTSRFPNSDEGSRSTLWTGSSSLDGSSHTQLCQSRYGIQDLVGNVSERTLEQIFCDFAGTNLFLGGSDESVSTAVSIDRDSGHYGQYFNDELVPFVRTASTTGTCSLIEAGATRSMAFQVDGVIRSIFDANSASGYDEDLLLSLHTFYQESVLDARSGDGSFLDFGQDAVGPVLNEFNTLALYKEDNLSNEEDYRRGRYFNPVLGLPLECGDTTCDAANVADNSNYTTSNFLTRNSFNAGDFEVADFPTNNSQITNFGLGGFTVQSRGLDLDDSEESFSYIHAIDPEATPDADKYIVEDVLDANEQDTPPTGLSRAYWRYSQENLIMSVGGYSSVRGAGRYSVNFIGSNSDRFNPVTTGTRCVVKIRSQ